MADLVVDALLQKFLPLARNQIENSKIHDGMYLRHPDPAYEQALDSVAMVATHAPLPLLEALLRWRESESPRGSDSPKGSAGSPQNLQRKLAIECIFTSACIRIAANSPLDGLPDYLWVGLEEFVFDWLITADRLVPQVDVTSLQDLRILLLDLIAKLAGALSTKRFQSLTARFFTELDSRVTDGVSASQADSLVGIMRHIPVVELFTRGAERLMQEFRRTDANSARLELLSLVNGMRHLKLSMASAIDVLASRAFLLKANPLSRTPSKKKLELQHSMCQMLTSILTPLVEDSAAGNWPPRGVGDAIVPWNATVLALRGQLSTWMDKQGTLSLQMDKQPRNMQVAWPLITLLLCLGDQISFEQSFSSYMEILYKLMREKATRSIALECLHRLLRFYLNVFAALQPGAVTRAFLQGVVVQLLGMVKRGGAPLDPQVDCMVDIAVTLAQADLNFAMASLVLELLRSEGLGEAKVIGLRTLLAIVRNVMAPPQPGSSDADESERNTQLLAFTAAPQGYSKQRTSSFSSWTLPAPRESTKSVDYGSMGLSPADSPLLAPHIAKIRAALGGIIKQCHTAYGHALLIPSSKQATEALPKERPTATGWVVFRWVLKCVPHLIPEQWRNDKMTEIIPVYAISVDQGVRNEAVQVLFRVVRDLPRSRFPILRGMMYFILRIPDDHPSLIHTSLTRFVQLLATWRACLAQERKVHAQAVPTAGTPVRQGKSNVNFLDYPGHERTLFDSTGMESMGLIFLCSVDPQIRRTSLDLLRGLRALQQDLAGNAAPRSMEGADGHEYCFVIDVFEETGEEIAQRAFRDNDKWYEIQPLAEAAPAEMTLLQAAEGTNRNRWGRCLSELVKYCAELCQYAVLGARLEVVARMLALTQSEPASKGQQPLEWEMRLEQWQLYAMFACSCPPEEAPDDGLQSIKELMNNVLPMFRSGVDAAMQSAILALGYSHVDICEAMLTELSTWVDEILKEMESRKWKNQKLRKEDIRILVAHVYRLVAQNLWPGELKRRPWLRHHFYLFVDETQKSVSGATLETLVDTQPIRFALAAVVTSLGGELVTVAPERFDDKTRKRLFELFASWCEDAGGVWVPEEARAYKGALESAMNPATFRTKDSSERLSAELDIVQQADAVQWMAMSAMVTLLYGLCFDGDLRKMAGPVVAWIKSLLEAPASSGDSPPGSISAKVRPSFSSASGQWPMNSDLQRSRGRKVGKSATKLTRRVGAEAATWRANLARDALLNLLITNSEIIPACIDQCYHQDPAIANGYFAVLAEVYMRQSCPECEVQRLLSLILYKVVDPTRRIRDDALHMLETLSQRAWAQGPEGEGRYRAAVVGSLPDSYQQFQYQLSARLAKEHPELSELLCEEIMQRQLDAVDIIAQHQVLTCMAPWMDNLNLVALYASGWSERLLKSLYYVTWRHGDQFPDEIEKLWSTIATKWRNIIPVLDFLIIKGIEDCDSNMGAEVGGALLTYFSVAKRISLYLARISPQQTIDHLVFELSQRRLEEDSELSPDRRRQLEVGLGLHPEPAAVLEFSQGDPEDKRQADVPPPPVIDSPQAAPAISNASRLHRRARSGGFSMGPWQHSRGSGAKSFSQPLAASGEESLLRTLPLSDKVNARSISGGSGKVNGGAHSRTSSDFSTGGADVSMAFTDILSSMGGSTAAPSMPFGEPPAGPKSSPSSARMVKLSRADIALILLAEIAYENDEDFRHHLPLLFHVTFVSMDSSEPILLEHAQQLLVNLLYTLAGRHLELYGGPDQTDAEHKQEVVSLIRYVQSVKGSLMWEAEDMALARTKLPSAALLSSLVLSTVKAIFFQGDLRERWGQEALKWAMECTSRHLTGRSHQIYRALRPSVTSATCVGLLRCLHGCFSARHPPELGFVMEILLTLQVTVETMEAKKVILYPQLFWGCVAVLHVDYVHIYTLALDLLARIIERLSFHDPTTENVIMSAMPRDGDGEADPARKAGDGMAGGKRGLSVEVEDTDMPQRGPPFEGIQPFVLKGLLSRVSHGSAIEVLCRITLLPCDAIFGASATRLLMHCVGLLPWLCLQLPQQAGSTGLPNDGVPAVSPLMQQQQKAISVAENIATSCDQQGLSQLASAFRAYAAGAMGSPEEVLARVAGPLAKEWFPRHAPSALGFLLHLLGKGPSEYQRVVILTLRALLQQASVDASQGSMIHFTVSQLLDNAGGRREAMGVLEAILMSTCTAPSPQSAHGAKPTRGQRTADARSGEGEFWAKQGLPGGNLKVKTSGRSQSLLPPLAGLSKDTPRPPREAALLNTCMALGRVLETYSGGL